MNKQEFESVKRVSERVYEDLPGIVVNNRVYILDIPLSDFESLHGFNIYTPEVIVNDGCSYIAIRDSVVSSNTSATKMEKIIANFVKRVKEYGLQICVVHSRIFMMMSIPVSAYFVKYCLEMNVSIKIIESQFAHVNRDSINMEKEAIEPIDNKYVTNDGYAIFGTPSDRDLSTGDIDFEKFPINLENDGFIPISSYRKKNIDGTDDHTFTIVENIRNLKKLGLGLFLVHAENVFDTIYCMKVCSFFEVPLKILIPGYVVNEEQDCIIDVIPKEAD